MNAKPDFETINPVISKFFLCWKRKADEELSVYSPSLDIGIFVLYTVG